MGPAVDGYWLDNLSYYFLAHKFDRSLGRIASIPSIADVERGRVEELISPRNLLHLISTQVGYHVQPEAMSAATIDLIDRETLGVSVGNIDCIIDTTRGCVRDAKASLSDAALYSADGKYACFLRGTNIWVRERASGSERALTKDGVHHYAYGQHSETNLSAFTYRQHPYPLGIWSPDSEWFLTYRIDDRKLPEFALTQSSPPGGGRFLLHHYKYPTPYDPLPTAIYVAIHVPTGRKVDFYDLPVLATSLPPFFAGSSWFGAMPAAWAIRFDRYFQRVELIKLDLQSGRGHIALTESVNSGYIDLHPVFGMSPNVRTLERTGEIIWYSERDGWGHLYLYDAESGELKNQITRGEWIVRDIVHIDERGRRILFTVGGLEQARDPAWRSLCAIDFDGRGFEVILKHEGDIFVPPTEPRGLNQSLPHRPWTAQPGVSPDTHFAVVSRTSVSEPTCVEVFDLAEHRTVTRLAIQVSEENDSRVRNFTTVAADGVTRLHGVLFLPPEFDEQRRYPLIDFIYPGPQYPHQPQSQLSVNAAPASALAELGFICMMIDTRGMPLRDRAFHQAGYGQLLEPQLSDHAAAVRQLCRRFSYIDDTRIGIIGQSAGGAATARALFDYAEIFSVGVAICGVHDSSLHMSMWSDKYRGPPDASWRNQANHTAAGKLQGKLLLISGDMDECVHVSHTLQLADALIHAGRDFDMLIVPNAGHDLLMTNAYVQRRVWDYFVRHLLGEEPPAHVDIRFEAHEVEQVPLRSLMEYR
jgi:dipeptidyl-peptidase 4